MGKGIDRWKLKSEVISVNIYTQREVYWFVEEWWFLNRGKGVDLDCYCLDKVFDI